MSNRILVLYGSYRSDRMGIRLANFVIDRLRERGEDVEFIDAKAIGLPMLDRMYKEHPKGAAPEALEKLAGQIRGADGFVFVTGEYNWGIQPGLKNLTDHFLEEWFWRPAAIVQLFRRPPVRRARLDRLARHAVGDGHGGGVEHHRRRADRADAVGRMRADRRGRQGAGACVSRALPTILLVDRGGQGAAGAQGAALLISHRKLRPMSERNRESYPTAPSRITLRSIGHELRAVRSLGGPDFARNRSNCPARSRDCVESCSAAPSTSLAAAPASSAARCTP
jgi:hypothetical protein